MFVRGPQNSCQCMIGHGHNEKSLPSPLRTVIMVQIFFFLLVYYAQPTSHTQNLSWDWNNTCSTQLHVQTLKDANSKRKPAAKGKLETKNKEFAFTFKLTKANYLWFLSALLKEHGFEKYTSVKRQHWFGIKISMGAKKTYIWTHLLSLMFFS